MADMCERCRNQIGPCLVGDLEPQERRELERHLSECTDCRLVRQEMEQALQALSSLEDVDVPRHHFVHDRSSGLVPGGLQGPLSWAWKGAWAALLGVFLISAGLLLSGLQIRIGSGSLTLAYGALPPESSLDSDALRRELVDLLEDRLHSRETVWMEQVRSEIRDAGDLLTQEQKREFTAILERVDSRWDVQLEQKSDLLAAECKAGMAGLYRTLYTQHRDDIDHLGSRIEIMNVRDEIRGSQTDALVSTLVQFADLQSRAPRRAQ